LTPFSQAASLQQRLRLGQRLAGVRSLDQGEFLGKGAREDAAQASAKQFVIINYEDACHSSAQNLVSLAVRGNRSVTRVPLG